MRRARVHHPSWRRGGDVAGGGKGAAAGGACHWIFSSRFTAGKRKHEGGFPQRPRDAGFILRRRVQLLIIPSCKTIQYSIANLHLSREVQGGRQQVSRVLFLARVWGNTRQ